MIRFICALLVSTLVTMAQAPTFNEAITVKCNNQEISVGSNSCPCVYDWTGDGKKDLLVGVFNGGNIHLFENEGTDAAPVFNSSTRLKAGGVTLSLSSG